MADYNNPSFHSPRKRDSSRSNSKKSSSSSWAPTSHLDSALRMETYDIDDIKSNTASPPQHDTLMESFLKRTQAQQNSNSILEDDLSEDSDGGRGFPGEVNSARVRTARKKHRNFDYYGSSHQDDGAGSVDDRFFDDVLDEAEDAMADNSRGRRGGGWTGGNDDSDDDWEKEFGQGSEKGALYDAYNLLHTLAQVSPMLLIVRSLTASMASIFIMNWRQHLTHSINLPRTLKNPLTLQQFLSWATNPPENLPS